MKLTLLFLVLLVLQSCNELPYYDATRVVHNRTSYDVSIYARAGFDSLTYFIAPFDSLLIDGECVQDEIDQCDLGWVESAHTEIIFDSVRILRNHPSSCTSLTFTARCLGQDPLYEIGGWRGERRGDRVFYIYEITQQDYDMAEEL